MSGYLNNVDMQSPTLNQTLIYDGSKWINQSFSSSSIVSSVNSSIFYIDNVAGDDTNDGSGNSPLLTITEAINRNKNNLQLYLEPSATNYTLTTSSLNYGYQLSILNSDWGSSETRTSIVSSGSVSSSTILSDLYSTNPFSVTSVVPSFTVDSSIVGYWLKFTSGVYINNIIQICGYDVSSNKIFLNGAYTLEIGR